MIKIMICDDIEEIRMYFSDLINSQDDMSVICMADSYKSAVELSYKHRPDIILMDIQMDTPDSGIRAAMEICKFAPEIKIIMLTIHDDIDLIIDSYISNAVDYILKDSDAETIYKSIRTAYNSDNYLGQLISNAIKLHINKSRKQTISLMYIVNNLSKLTTTELKILTLLCKNKKKAEIAATEFISPSTLKVHIRHILHKLNFESTKEMVAFLNDLNLLTLLENSKNN